MEIRDPVHNFIDLTDTEIAVINHPSFQRLRRTRQLAMADLVYPGAVHHRFEHSLGVCHVAGRVAKQLLLDDDQIRYVRLAALVHDIGHGPFSHVSEEPLAEVNRRWLEESKVPEEKIHEQMGLEIIRHQLVAGGVIEKPALQEICAILDTVGNKRRTIARDIVSGPLDADKMDYLLRDSLFCGVKYGVYDLERLIRALRVIKQGTEQFIGVHADDVAVVDQFVIARFNMSIQVYGHKTRRATDLMLNRAIMKAIDFEDAEIIDAYTFIPDDKDMGKYLDFDDRVLMAQLLRSKSTAAQKLARCLMMRDLPARICYRPLDQVVEEELAQELADKNKRKNATEKIRNHFFRNFKGADHDRVFVEVVDSKPIGKFNDLPEVDPEQIYVVRTESLLPRTLPKESHFFRDYQFTKNPHLAVYTNLEEQKSESHEDCRKRAGAVLNDFFSESS